MNYEIRGTVLQTVDLKLEDGEQVFTQSGGMAWMSPNMSMTSGVKGGLLAGLGRAMAGGTLFLVDYQATGGPGQITFASEFPGNILPLKLEEGQSMICQKDAFLVAQAGVALDTFFRRKLGAGLFGGEGFFLQKITGPGMAFVQLAGEITEYPLEAGQSLRVDPGHVAMFEPSVSFAITMVNGIKNIVFGGEGLFLADLQGPGRVWLQSMPLSNLAKRLIPYLPKKSS